jgi:hypothetical protein
MAAHRGLTLLGALVALLVALFGAAWMWLSFENRAPQVQLLGSAALVLVSSLLASRCVGHLLDTFGIGGVRAAAHHTPTVCPSCAAPLRTATPRCPSCLELL